jgi:hypothetical protein
MTETELVMASLTREELEEAVRWLYAVRAHWLALSDAEKEGQGFGTDGAWHLIRAMDLALLREQAARGGADDWFVGMPTDGHPAAGLIRMYQARLQLNPNVRDGGRLTAAGILVARCLRCHKEKPLTVSFWHRAKTTWMVVCRACSEITDDEYRDAVLKVEEEASRANAAARDQLGLELADLAADLDRDVLGRPPAGARRP